jgi:hypothetical protein
LELADFAALDPLLNWARQILPDQNALAQEGARAIETADPLTIAQLLWARNSTVRTILSGMPKDPLPLMCSRFD